MTEGGTAWSVYSTPLAARSAAGAARAHEPGGFPRIRSIFFLFWGFFFLLWAHGALVLFVVLFFREPPE
jgi:hypothetical protein